jgi:hypothetical protein
MTRADLDYLVAQLRGASIHIEHETLYFNEVRSGAAAKHTAEAAELIDQHSAALLKSIARTKSARQKAVQS